MIIDLKSASQTPQPMQAAKTVRICIPYEVSDDFAAACEAALAGANTAGITFDCVKGDSAEGCSKMIADGQADVTKLGGEEAVTVTKLFIFSPEFELFFASP
jgi:hypothetical protein